MKNHKKIHAYKSQKLHHIENMLSSQIITVYENSHGLYNNCINIYSLLINKAHSLRSKVPRPKVQFLPSLVYGHFYI